MARSHMAAEGNVMKPYPLLTRVLRALLPPHSRDAITGDLLEEFRERTSGGVGAAQRWYARQVWSFVTSATWFSCAVRTSSGWFAVFAVSCARTVSVPEFAPGSSVAVFLFALPSLAFYVARRTESFRAGFVAALLTGCAMFTLAVGLILKFHLRHPPASATPLPFAVCLGMAFVASLAGKCSAERLEPARLSL